MLSHLPAELLWEICEYLPKGGFYGRLWATGDHILRAKLSGTTKWIAKAVNRNTTSRIMPVWPRTIFSALTRLEHLEMDLGTDRVHANIFTLDPADWMAFPPTLTSIKFAISVALTDATVALIPRTVTSLILDNEEGLSGPVVADLPPGLLVFSVWMPGLRDHHLPLLPPNLTKLCLWTGASHFNKETVAANLPVHITRLRISYLSVDIGNMYYERLNRLGIATEEQTRMQTEGLWGRF